MRTIDKIKEDILNGKMITADDFDIIYKKNIDYISKTEAHSLYSELFMKVEKGERSSGIEVNKDIFNNKYFQAKIEQFKSNGFNVKARQLQNGKMFVVVSF